ncbi:MAG: OmpH family outer membrane protein [Lachnospiraceae bacterium]|nr:OmpH family outer membrane protein [Lachnospiraceae bacterium]
MKNLKIVLAAACVMLFAACNDKKSGTETAPANVKSGELKIAYVEIDSLMSQYQFCKDYTLLLTKKGENIRATLNQKAKTLDSDAQEFQRKLQNNAYTQERAEQENARLVKMQQDLQALQERLSNEFDAETAKYNNAMRDSITSFLKIYNKEKGYNLVLSKAGDNMLLADPALDITNDVIAGLNKRYVPSKELIEVNAETTGKK